MKKFKEWFRKAINLIDRSQQYLNPFDKNEEFGAFLLATLIMIIPAVTGYLINYADIYWLQIVVAILGGLVGLGFGCGLMLASKVWVSILSFILSVALIIIFEDEIIPKEFKITSYGFFVCLFLSNSTILLIWSLILIAKRTKNKT